jgi:hypothetical protein
MLRDNWILHGFDLERQLNEYMRKQSERSMNDTHTELKIFDLEMHAREEKKALEYFKNDGKVRYRYQRWWEKIGSLRLAHDSMLALTILWFSLFFVKLVFFFVGLACQMLDTSAETSSFITLISLVP